MDGESDGGDQGRQEGEAGESHGAKMSDSLTASSSLIDVLVLDNGDPKTPLSPSLAALSSSPALSIHGETDSSSSRGTLLGTPSSSSSPSITPPFLFHPPGPWLSASTSSSSKKFDVVYRDEAGASERWRRSRPENQQDKLNFIATDDAETADVDEDNGLLDSGDAFSSLSSSSSSSSSSTDDDATIIQTFKIGLWVVCPVPHVNKSLGELFSFRIVPESQLVQKHSE